MANWEAPVTHNETDPDDSGTPRRSAVSVYLDAATGRYRLWVGSLPVGYDRAYFANDAVTGRVILRDDPTDVRIPFLYGDKRVII